MTPTVDVIMNTRPCWRWPRERVEATLAQLDHPASWTELAERSRAAGWPVTIMELRLTAYRAATPEQCLAGVMDATRRNVESADRLLAWAEDNGGGAIREDAALRAAYAYALAIRSADALDADDSAAVTSDAADADADAAWASLAYICQLLDGGAP